MKKLEIATPSGTANAHVHLADAPLAALVLGHGAGGGVEARDLVAVAGAGMPPSGERRTVVQVESDHSLRTDLGSVTDAVRAWLARVVGESSATRRQS